MTLFTRRPILPLLLALGFAAVAATPSRADIRINIGRGDGKAVTYAISYTPAGEKVARHFGTYETSEDASAVASSLQRDGHAVHIRAGDAVVPAVGLPEETDAGAAGICTLAEAQRAFAELAAQKDIAFEFPADGCYARAHLMCKRLQQAGFRPGKVWSFANGRPLYAATTHHPDKSVTWGYHVAPALAVMMPDNRVIVVVMDPSLIKGAATVAKWRDAQKWPGSKYDPIIRITKLGAAPVLADGTLAPGHGYWTGADPRDPDAFSAAIMKKYKPWENRRPPAELFKN